MRRLKCAVLVSAYPSAGTPYRMMYVHTRLLAYREDVDLQVVSLTASEPYEYEGVAVKPADAGEDFGAFDAVVVHAPVKRHLDLLHGYAGPLIVFLHGFEALNRVDYYPRPYPWQGLSRLAWRWKPLRDAIKLRRLRRFLLQRTERVQVITVSDWMRTHMLDSLGFPDAAPFPITVIPNAVNPIFERNAYDWSASKTWDFITIRPFDQPKYGADIVVACAERNPQLKFLLVGEGELFEHVNCPPNLEVRKAFIPPADIPALLDGARAALLPTRQDTQGVMACECAQYGIPLVSSDIAVCREVLGGRPLVTLLPNDRMPEQLSDALNAIKPAPRTINLDWSLGRTAGEELRVIRAHVEKNSDGK